MVSSLDGKAAVEGTTRSLGSEADRELFHHLRTQADALLVGAGTVRLERYGRAVKSDELRAKREQEGLDPDLLTVIVSGRLDLPADLPLFQEPESRVVIATGAEHELDGTRRRRSPTCAPATTYRCCWPGCARSTPSARSCARAAPPSTPTCWPRAWSTSCSSASLRS